MRSKCGLWLGTYAVFNNRTAGMRWQGEPLMLPLPRGQAVFTVASLDSYYILRQTQHPAETWQWILFLLNHQEAAGAQIPARRSLIASQAFADRVAADALGVARNLPDNVFVLSGSTLQNAESVFSVYMQAVDAIVREKADIKSTLAAAQKKAAASFGQ
jgi:hypothetical protein